MASSLLGQRTIEDFAKSKGSKRDDLSTKDRAIFELSVKTFRELMEHQEDIEAGLRGAKHLPEVMLIGLVSAYDAFLAKLLRVVFSRHQELILTSEKNIKFSELLEFDSIEAARSALIDREIESVLRESHQEHFNWMEKKFKVSLKELPAFSKFVELCERRNLLTHTGGIVSTQYVTNCKKFSVYTRGANVGDRLTVNAVYYREAVNIICEIGIKLCYVLWRKFVKDERERADSVLNEFCYDLITQRNYSTAEAILSLSTAWVEIDRCRRTMIVNQANAIRLQDRSTEAIKLLDREDWSAVSEEFRISVAAIHGDADEVIDLMKKIGSDGRPSAEEYRSWPVFQSMRANSKFSEAYAAVFGEPLILPKPADVTTSIPLDSPESTGGRKLR